MRQGKKLEKIFKNFEIISCPLCNSSLSEVVLSAKNIHGRIFISEDEFTWVRCKRCSLSYLNPRPKEDAIWEYYPADYYSLGIGIQRELLHFFKKLYNLKRLKFIKKFAPLRSRLLDLGCGEGEFVRAAQKFDFEAFGVEPYILKKKLKDYTFQSEFFDVVTLWHVLEHLHHPKDELSEVKRILKKDGWLFLSLPNLRSLGFLLGRNYWYHLDTPRHLFGYEKKTVLKMLESSGFRVVKLNFLFFENPADLFETMMPKIFGEKNYLKIVFALPLLGISLALKAILPLFGWSETMQIVACKR